MAASETPAPTVRTYGNFRRPESAGIGRLGTIGTGVLLAGIIVTIILMTFRLVAVALLWALVLAGLLGLMAVKDHHGRSGIARLGARVVWRRTRHSHQHLYRSGPLGRAGWGTFQLPGLLAATTLHEFTDSYARPFGIVETPSVGHFSIVIACEPDGASLVDPEQVDSWVAHWGLWLATLGQETGVVAASVTVETAPDTGARLRREIDSRIDTDAPDLAKQMLRQVVASYPTGSAQIRAWVALTFDARTHSGRRRTVDEMGRDLASRLPSLTQQLSATGAGAARPMSARAVCEVVRVSYDPAAASIIDDAYTGGQSPDLTWDEVGPSATEASWDSYRHDGAWSRTWMMSTAPRGEVFSSVLSRLLAPSADIDRKRVTIVYRPLDPGRAARIVEQDKRASDFRVASAPRPSARAISSARAATATAAEEARGAGLVDFGMLITATVNHQSRMPDARAAVENLAATARLQIRPAYGSQDSAFAACLPLGLVLPAHLRVPTEIRNAL